MANKKFTDLDPAGANPTLVDTDIMAVTLDPGGTPVSRKTSISNLMGKAPVQSVAGRTGAVTLSDTDIAGLGTAATTASTDYATAAQGTTADSAVQPTDSINVLSDVSINNPADGSILKYVSANSQYEEASLGTASTADSSDFATSAQGALADTAVQPTDGIEALSNVSINNPADGSILKYVSANSQYEESSDFATSTQGALADTAVQPAGIANMVETTDSIDVLADVDTSTVSPSDGQALVWDNTASQWEPGSIDVDTPLNTALRGTTNPHIGAYPNQSFKVIDNPYKSVMVLADEAGNLKLLNSLGANNIAVGFSVVEDGVEPDIEVVSGSETYSVISGDSDSKGGNGLPFRQGFNNPDIGANPAPILISGGSIA